VRATGARRRGAATALVLAVAGMAVSGCAPTAEEVLEDVAAEAPADAAGVEADVRAQVEEALEGAGLPAGLRSEVDRAVQDALAGGGPAPAPAPAAGLAIAAIDEAVASVRREVGTEVLQVVQVQLTSGGRISFHVRDPDDPDRVDDYVWAAGVVAPPQPVPVGGVLSLDERAFPISEARSAGAQAAYDAGLGLGLEGGEVPSMILQVSPFRPLSWVVPVSGARESKVVYAAPDGTVREVV
jgi:hypothetical protein